MTMTILQIIITALVIVITMSFFKPFHIREGLEADYFWIKKKKRV